MNNPHDIESVFLNTESLLDAEILDAYLSTNQYEARAIAIASEAYGFGYWGIDDTIEVSFLMFLNLLIKHPSDHRIRRRTDGKVMSGIILLLMLGLGFWVAIKLNFGFYGGFFVVSAVYLVLYGAAKSLRGPVTMRQARTRNNMCRSCGYSLQGLESVGFITEKGGEFDIGPLICPECGSAYPRLLDTKRQD